MAADTTSSAEAGPAERGRQRDEATGVHGVDGGVVDRLAPVLRRAVPITSSDATGQPDG